MEIKRILVIVFFYVFTLGMGHLFVSLICKSLNFYTGAQSGIKHAGMIIGIFERFLILTFVLLNQYMAMGLIFTAKSIARFEDLKKREFSEYYLVGTLASFSFAVVCGLILKWLLIK
ncbi:MAG: hypothetical protein J7L42_00375 [Elusimicrobia bacterium]|nr:hypothetical protein [Elusimicrobiota bacterium]